ncbi:hypothetical protein D9M72_556810 [compost metagenome]
MVQKANDACGRIAQDSAMEPKKPAAIQPSALKSRRTRKYRPNASGVSFTPAASPISRPAGHRISPARDFPYRAKSARIRPIRMMLIWPNTNVSRHGPRSRIAPVPTKAVVLKR